MADHPDSAPKRAVGDTTYSFISHSSRGQVDGEAWSAPTDGTAMRHQVVIVVGVIVAIVGFWWVLAAHGLVVVLAGAVLAAGVALTAWGFIGRHHEKVALRRFADRIDREQGGPVD